MPPFWKRGEEEDSCDKNQTEWVGRRGGGEKGPQHPQSNNILEERENNSQERERESSFHLFQSLVDNIFFERVCEEKRVKKPRVRSEEHCKALTHLLLLPFRAYNSGAKLNGKAKAKTDCCRVPFAERRRGGGNHPEIFS